MCPSCVSSSPGLFVPATVFLLGKRELWGTFWIPAFAGMTPLTRVRFAQTVSPAGGEASCFIRLKCYGKPYQVYGVYRLGGIQQIGHFYPPLGRGLPKENRNCKSWAFYN